MFDRIVAMLEGDGSSNAPSYSDQDVRTAVAALYYHIISADGVITPKEMNQFSETIRAQFNVSEDDLKLIMSSGAVQGRESPGVFPFTAVLNTHFDRDARKQIFDNLVDLAESDGRVDRTERNVLDHIATLLHLDDETE